MSRSRSFAHSVAWNLAGAGVPLAFAIFAIPRLLQGYGSERFGFLAIAWSLIGYFSIFDLGIGRALTKLVAEKLAVGESGGVPDIARTALVAMFAFGCLACLVLMGLAPSLAGILKLGPQIYRESVTSIRILALGVPFVITSAGLVGLLEAHGRFRSINTIRLTMGLMNFAAPLVVLAWSQSLVPATIALATCRAVTTIFYLWTVKQLQVGERAGQFRSDHLRTLLGFGGWITLSNLISPIMAQLDKLIIGSVIALTLLPLYAIPSDVVNRLSFAPIAMIAVFFPSFASRWAAGDEKGISSLYGRTSRAMIAAIYPAALTIYTLAPEGLSLWMGKEFADQSSSLLRCLCLGLVANTAARVPHALLQAIGKPSTTAMIHLLELPIYAVGLLVLLSNNGILGASMAWTGRMILDLVLLTVCAAAAVPGIRTKAILALATVVTGGALMHLPSLLPELWLRLFMCALISLVGFASALRILLRIRHNE
ncbi:flippase [Pseudoxanthomonas suwonensis]|uniref:flippase n=1 Tax=Pseudoxanthomonas suwonensis TaxID=314722 RepID=UPI0018CBF81C|nr:flippase [Pseudoxanthomonas suwonensis]